MLQNLVRWKKFSEAKTTSLTWTPQKLSQYKGWIVVYIIRDNKIFDGFMSLTCWPTKSFPNICGLEFDLWVVASQCESNSLAPSLSCAALPWSVLVGEPGWASKSRSSPARLVMLLYRERASYNWWILEGRCWKLFPRKLLFGNILPISFWYKA